MKYLLTCWLFVVVAIVVASHPLGMPTAIIINNGKNNNNIRETEREGEKKASAAACLHSRSALSLILTLSCSRALSLIFMEFLSWPQKYFQPANVFFFCTDKHAHRRAWTCRLADDKHASPLLNLFSRSLPLFAYALFLLLLQQLFVRVQQKGLICCVSMCVCMYVHASDVIGLAASQAVRVRAADLQLNYEADGTTLTATSSLFAL